MDFISFNITFTQLFCDIFELFPLFWPIVFILSLLFSIRCIVRKTENQHLLLSVVLSVFSLMVMIAPMAVNYT